MVAKDRAENLGQSSFFIMQIRWLWREQWPFKVSTRNSRRMRDIWSMVCDQHFQQELREQRGILALDVLRFDNGIKVEEPFLGRRLGPAGIQRGT